MKIFFSHSSEDKALVREIKSKLHDFLDIWLDEKKLIIGESLNKEIESGIKSADYMVIFISNNSLKSDWVQKEIDFALNKEKILQRPFILPVKIGECSIPIQLKDKLYLMLNSQNESEISYLSNALNENLFQLSIKFPLTKNEQDDTDGPEDAIGAYVLLLKNTVNDARKEYSKVIEEHVLLKPKIVLLMIKDKAEELIALVDEKKGMAKLLEKEGEQIKAIQADTWFDINQKIGRKVLNKLDFIENNTGSISSEEGLFIMKNFIDSL